MPHCRKSVLRMLLLILCLSPKLADAQRVFMNSPQKLYEITGGIGSCTHTEITLCSTIYQERLYSIAYHKGILYVLTMINNLYAIDMNNPGSCTFLTTFPGRGANITSMTIDKSGVIWGIYSLALDLISFDPVTGIFEDHGKVPIQPSGDLVFYQNKMLYAAADATIYEVNVRDPIASTPFMATSPYSFFGVIAFPDQCNKNKIYGIAAGENALIELDLENRRIVGKLCDVPDNIYDAGSEVEDGNTIGVTINSARINAPCVSSENTGDIEINATTAGIGTLTFTLNSTITNQTGIFTGLPMGQHTVKISNSLGCVTDTSVLIARGVQAPVGISTTDPVGCGPDNGSIRITATSPYALSYSLNNGVHQAGNEFSSLAAGLYVLQVKDAGGCVIDTSAALKLQDTPPFIRNMDIQHTVCESKTGYIKINAPAGTLTSLNSAPFSSAQQYTQLDAGTYQFAIKYNGDCIYDTTIRIEKQTEPAPVINMLKTDQMCNENNGSIRLNISGPGSPYTSSVNNGSFKADNRFDGLPPGSHALLIQSSNKCEWKQTAAILPYRQEPFNSSFTLQHPGCEVLTDGMINIIITGPQNPYYVSLNGITYQDNIIRNLVAGNYELKWYNRDHCVLKTEQVELKNRYAPVCDNVFMPSAFTPNGDGLNDVFKPVMGSPVTSGIILTIYNRYGELIFRSTNGHGWDGTYRNIRQHAGVYVWTFEYRTFAGTGKMQKGTVTLIR